MSTNAEEVNNDSPPASPLPAITAAFLVKFDDRKGYTLAWQKSNDNVTLDGVVEFKSMPSGLHNVSEDLVYFVYGDYAGVSAVLNIEDEDAARKARVIAVGILVPLEHGRLGKSWLHAEGLKALAAKQIHEKDDYSLLEKFWDEHNTSASSPDNGSDSAPKQDGLTIDTKFFSSKSNGYRISRTMSMATVPGSSEHYLPAHHPALVLPEFLRLFGPLVFPLVRAAVLRKRILFLGEAPVEKTCDFVYNLSILSALPKPIATILPDLDPAYLRLRPLFNIGVADITFLEEDSKSTNGWIACTTDDVICTKPNLFDVLVVLPSETAQSTNLRPFPKVFWSSPELSRARPKHGMRASQRDAKRFTNMSKGLSTIPRSYRKQGAHAGSAITSPSEGSQEANRRSDPAEISSVISTASSTISLKSVVEPSSWSRIAYTSLIWWASAGDTRSGLTEAEENENEQDVALLTGEDLGEDGDDGDANESKTREITCVQYFHRWTNMIFTAVSEAIRRNDEHDERYRDDDNEALGDEDGNPGAEEDGRALLENQDTANKTESGNKIEITQEDMQNMGLDVWSQSDRQFVQDLITFWWQREADVQSGRIECCGVRIM